MPWWGWLIVGIVLFSAELFLVDAEFYLVFIGLSAVIVGLTSLLGLALPAWGEWMLFAALALVSMVMFRRRLYRILRPIAEGFEQKLSGETLEVLREPLAPGKSCRAEFRGTTWTIQNDSDTTIEVGEIAMIERVDGLTLHVTNASRPANPHGAQS